MKSDPDASASQPFDYQDVLQLVELMKSTTQFSEFRLRANGIELELRRGAAGPASAVAAPTPASTPAAPASPPAAAPAAAPASPPSLAPGAAVRQGAGESAFGRAIAKRAEPPERAAGDAVVDAPMVGTVYLAPEPGAAPFVTLGQAVEADTQVCIVEVMKLMNSVVAGCKGVVADILVADGETVEYGQGLFVIRPA
jgi:acetyl-CoA carboxylase biotin carboxyl carrier protein